MLPAKVIGIMLAALAAAYGAFLFVRTLKSGKAISMGGPYLRESRPVMYWLSTITIAAFTVACLSFLIQFVVSR